MTEADKSKLQQYSDRLFKAQNTPGPREALVAMTKDEADELAELIKAALTDLESIARI